MRVLIVDDQIHVVNGIVNGVDWKSLGVEEPLELKYDGFDENFEAVILSLQS